jgi:hypothetical protein
MSDMVLGVFLQELGLCFHCYQVKISLSFFKISFSKLIRLFILDI